MRAARESSVGMALDMLKSTDEEAPMLEKVKILLEKFSDVLIDNLHAGLPPLKDIQHVINLILGSIRPNRLA